MSTTEQIAGELWTEWQWLTSREKAETFPF